MLLLPSMFFFFQVKLREIKNFVQALKAIDQLSYLISFLDVCMETRQGRSSANERQLMVSMTFESIYGRVLYEPNDVLPESDHDPQLVHNQLGRLRATQILGMTRTKRKNSIQSRHHTKLFIYFFSERLRRITHFPINDALSYYRIFCYDDFIIPLIIYRAGTGKKACSS